MRMYHESLSQEPEDISRFCYLGLLSKIKDLSVRYNMMRSICDAANGQFSQKVGVVDASPVHMALAVWPVDPFSDREGRATDDLNCRSMRPSTKI